MLEAQPTAAGQSLIALDFLLGSVRELAVIAGSDAAEFKAVLETIATRFESHKVVAPASPEQAAQLAEILPLLAGRPAHDGKTTTYICEHFTCSTPVRWGCEAWRAALAKLRFVSARKEIDRDGAAPTPFGIDRGVSRDRLTGLAGRRSRRGGCPPEQDD